MSPEQLRGDPLDPRTDLFSLGVLLYQLAGGKKPFHGACVKSLCKAILTADPKPLAALNPRLPADLAALIHRLLAKRPDDRPATAAAVCDELSEIEARLPEGEEPLPLDPAPASRSGTRVPKVVDVTRRWWVIGKDRLLWVSLVGLFVSLGVGAGLGLALRGSANLTHSASGGEVSKPAAELPPLTLDLFDGRTLNGWHGAERKVDRWAVENGVLVGTPMGKDQFLVTDAEYTDFDLRFEYRWPEKGGHTQVYLRAKVEQEPNGETRVSGLRLNLGDDDHFPEIHGKELGGRYRTGGIEGVRCPANPPNRPIGEWNVMQVRSVRQKMTVVLNGQTTFDQHLGEHLDKVVVKEIDLANAVARTKGAIALSTHQTRPIEFRNIRIQIVEPPPPK